MSESWADIQAFWKAIRKGKQVLGGGRKSPHVPHRLPPDARTPDALKAHRAHMLHDVLPSARSYRKALRQAAREYDALMARERSTRPRGRGGAVRGPAIQVGKKKRYDRRAA